MVMSLDDVFDFGKHEGIQLEEVIEDHPSYIAWCCEEGVVDFDEEAMELISRKGIA